MEYLVLLVLVVIAVVVVLRERPKVTPREEEPPDAPADAHHRDQE